MLPTREQLAVVAALVILAVWTVGFLVEIVVTEFDPHPSVTPLMLAVAAWCFTRKGPPDDAR